MLVAVAAAVVVIAGVWFLRRSPASSGDDRGVFLTFKGKMNDKNAGSMQVFTSRGDSVFTGDDGEWEPVLSVDNDSVPEAIFLRNKKQVSLLVGFTHSGQRVDKPEAVPFKTYSEDMAAARPSDASSAACGYADRTFKMAVPAQYDDCGDFSEGLAAVGIGPKVGYINRSGQLKIPMVYEVGCKFSDGLAQVRAAGQVRYVNTGGKAVLDIDRNTVGTCASFSEGRLPFGTGRGAGYLDKSGKVAIPARYNAPISLFQSGRAFVRNEGLLKMIDREGKEVPTPAIERAEAFEDDGLARVAHDGQWGLIDTSGRLVVTPTYESIEPLHSGLRMAKRKGQEEWSKDFLDRSGHKAKTPMNSCLNFSKGVFVCREVKALPKETNPFLAMVLSMQDFVYVPPSGRHIPAMQIEGASKN